MIAVVALFGRRRDERMMAGFFDGSRPFLSALRGNLAAVFTCSTCQKQTSYDPFRCARRGQQEEHDGTPHWCLYLYVLCVHCGREKRILWRQEEIKP